MLLRTVLGKRGSQIHVSKLTPVFRIGRRCGPKWSAKVLPPSRGASVSSREKFRSEPQFISLFWTEGRLFQGEKTRVGKLRSPNALGNVRPVACRQKQVLRYGKMKSYSEAANSVEVGKSPVFCKQAN
jgi:hypothetical protein